MFTVTRISGLPSHNGENDGEVVAVITSGEDGTAVTPLLTWGEYQIVETACRMTIWTTAIPSPFASLRVTRRRKVRLRSNPIPWRGSRVICCRFLFVHHWRNEVIRMYITRKHFTVLMLALLMLLLTLPVMALGEADTAVEQEVLVPNTPIRGMNSA